MSKTIYKNLFALHFLLSVFVLNAQSYNFKYLTAEHGLSMNTVTSIAQDSMGYMWFGTENGLNRFDGYEIKSYFSEPGDTSSLSGNRIIVLFTSGKGRLWIGTASGLNSYDYQGDRFIQFDFAIPNDSNIHREHVSDIKADKDARLFIATKSGYIYSLDVQTDQFVHFPFKDNGIGAIHCLFFDSTNQLWCGIGNYLGKFKGNALKLYKTNDSGTRDEVMAITESSGNLFLSLFPGGCAMFNPEEGKTINLISDPPISMDCIADKKRHIWFATIQGVAIYEPKEERKRFLMPDDFNPHSLNEPGVLSIYQDGQSNYWLGMTSGGVNYTVNDKQFNTSIKIPGAYNTPSKKMVKAIYVDRQKNVWIGYKEGTDKFDYSLGEKLSTYMPGIPNNIGIASVWFFAEHNGQLLAGNYEKGVLFLNHQKNTFEKFPFPKEIDRINKDARSIAVDSKGRLWIVLHGTGLLRADTKKKQYKLFTQENSGIVGDWANFIFCDDKDNIWVASFSGLSLLVEGDSVFTNFFHDPEAPGTLSSNIVNTVFQDSDKKIWIGTAKGMNLYDPASRLFKKFNNNAGIQNMNIASLLEDANRNIWASTRGDGLFKFNLGTLRQIDGQLSDSIVFYDYGDGLQSNEFFPNSAFRHKSRLYFGGTKGISWFEPQKIHADSTPPRVYITDFFLFNKKVEIGDNTGILEKDIAFCKNIELRYDQNIITFRFTAISFLQPRKNTYAYYLEGFEKDWNYAGTKREATYTNLPAGTYILKLKAANSDGLWNPQVTELVVKVLPPFWQTFWFKVLLVFFIALVIFTYMKYKTYKFRLREKKLEKLVNERTLKLEKMADELRRANNAMHNANEAKTRFFMNVSHEFRTPLTLILGPLENIITKNLAPKVNNQLGLIQRNTKRLLRLVNQLLDLRKLETGNMKLHVSRGDIVAFVHAIFESFEYLAKRGNIDFQLKSSAERLVCWFDTDVLEKILYNLISNAFKYTKENGNIIIRLEHTEDAQVKISVEDTGIGIKKELLPHIFERFYRVEDSEFRKQSGTGIGLALTRELVELHKGEISVSSREGKGSLFSFSITTGQEDFEDYQLSKHSTSAEIEKYPHITKENDYINEDAGTEDEKISGKERLPIALLIDDNPDIRIFLKSCLTDSYRILEAENGKQGFESAIKKMPDLIIADIMMPVMDGIKMTRQLKTDLRTSHIPVILLTAKIAEEDQVHGFETGADDYILKPFSPEVLRARAQNLIKSRKKLRELFSANEELTPEKISPTGTDKAFLEKAKKSIEDNLHDPDFSANFLASELCMSRSNLFRKFKVLTNTSLNELLNTMRLNKAVKLLDAGYSIKEVIDLTGFSNHSYFGRAFKKKFGFPPSEYNKNK